MKAICIESGEGRPQLVLREVARPEPGPHELLVAVRCAGVNFADLARAARHFGAGGGPQGPAIAGLEVAGEVVAVGAQVRGVQVGDRVMGLAQATYAGYCCIDHRVVLPVPPGLSWPEAAAIPAAFMTAHDALTSNGELQPGETVLVQAASSGVGIAALQIARALGAGMVIGTSTSHAKLERLAALGLQHGIHSRECDFAQAVLEITGGHGADLIVENIGGPTLPGDVRCAAVKGRIVNVGRMGGGTGEIDLEEHSRKRIRLIGVTWRTRSVDEHAQVVRKAGEALLPLLASGAIRPVVDRAFPLEQAAAAQDYLQSGKHFGKVVLTIDATGSAS
jgi:NADPH:quinone reductase-like Zn-dependent oxidoreductase